ncbi:hypothetical protein D9615_003185 [Tricholomella constricta]|uniref:Transmembrane protein n=1 Tax=Tricholomella constricta TaxID=117010 RepID=A0A8H5M854_9AGAR|nr:hypothetical protein D9615_003185 [Tricholomella constricta]
MLFVVLFTYAVISSFFVQCGPGSLQFIEESRRLYLLAGASARSIAASPVSLPPTMLDLFLWQEEADFKAFSRFHQKYPQDLLIHALQPEPQRTNNATNDDLGPEKYVDLEPLITPVLQQLWRDHKKSRSTELAVLWVACVALSVLQLYQILRWCFSNLCTPRPKWVNGTNQGALHVWALPPGEPMNWSVDVLRATNSLPADEDVIMESPETPSNPLLPPFMYGVPKSEVNDQSTTHPINFAVFSDLATSSSSVPAAGTGIATQGSSAMNYDTEAPSTNDSDAVSTVGVSSESPKPPTSDVDAAPSPPSEVAKGKRRAIDPVSDDEDTQATTSRAPDESQASGSAGPSTIGERHQTVAEAEAEAEPDVGCFCEVLNEPADGQGERAPPYPHSPTTRERLCEMRHARALDYLLMPWCNRYRVVRHIIYEDDERRRLRFSSLAGLGLR